jgi:ABC-type branched-subunit amino acid transport system substrate-binding protein
VLSLARAVAPLLVLVVVAVLAREALAIRPAGVAKIALLHAFSGPLKEQGYDALSATRAAIRSRTDARGLAAGKRVELEALDDGATRDGAARQIAALANDPDLLKIVCCSVDRVTRDLQEQQTARVVFPGLLAARPEFADGDAMPGVRTLAAKVHPARPALVGSTHEATDPWLAALARTWHIAGVTPFQPEQGYTLEKTARSLLDSGADAVLLDMDAFTASKLVVALREQGYGGPVVGAAHANVPELVTWVGPRLGELYAPSIVAGEVPSELVQAFARERGHPPASADVLVYDAVRTALQGPSVTHHWTLVRLAAGRFPGTDAGDA